LNELAFFPRLQSIIETHEMMNEEWWTRNEEWGMRNEA
jgi:hypothetical protein